MKRYWLEIVQQPVQARISRASLRDRRTVDPPPILPVNSTQYTIPLPLSLPTPLHIPQPHPSLSNRVSTLQTSITLPTPPSSNSTVPLTSIPVRIDGLNYRSNRKVITGTLTSQCFTLVDPDGRLGCFFVFPEVSVRSSGDYRLKFDLYDLGRAATQGLQTSLATVISDIFHVYSPQNFPGMAASTAYTQCFSRQGVKIIRRYDMR
ncbi:velvet factor [Chytridium lagenaria]|nr:velvet factor [Chytridium lagenaria]